MTVTRHQSLKSFKIYVDVASAVAGHMSATLQPFAERIDYLKEHLAQVLPGAPASTIGADSDCDDH